MGRLAAIRLADPAPDARGRPATPVAPVDVSDAIRRPVRTVTVSAATPLVTNSPPVPKPLAPSRRPSDIATWLDRTDTALQRHVPRPPVPQTLPAIGVAERPVGEQDTPDVTTCAIRPVSRRDEKREKPKTPPFYLLLWAKRLVIL